jgi:hypothetical protein
MTSLRDAKGAHSNMNVGDKVKLIGIPPDTHDVDDMHTLTIFQRCLGNVFPIAGVDVVEGLKHPIVKLEVGHVIGRRPSEEVIWVEPRYLELVNSK